MLSQEELSNIATEEKVPLSLFLATYKIESSSGTDPTAYVPHDGGIVGPFQVSPGTFSDMVGPGQDINDEHLNAVAAARYLKQGLDRYGGDPKKAYLYYHGGPNEANWGPKTNAAANKVVEAMNTSADNVSEGLPSQAALSVPQEGQVQTGVPDYQKKIAQLSEDVERALKTLQETKQASEEYQGEYNKSVAERINAQKGVSDAYALIYNAMSAMHAHRALGVTNVLTNYGIDDEQVNNLQAVLGTKIRQETEQLLPMREALKQKADAVPEFYQNPIGYIMGTFDLKKDIAVHNNLQGQINQDKHLHDILTSSVANLQAVNLAKKSMYEATQAIGEGALHVAQSQDALARIKEEAAKGNQTFKTQQLQDDLQVFKLHREELALLESSEGKEEQMRAKAVKVQTDAEALNIKNSGLSMLGYQEVPSIDAYNKLPKKQRDVVESVIASGGTKFGPDALTAYQNVSAGDVRRMSNDTQAMLEINKAVVQKVDKSLAGVVPKEALTQNIVFEALKPGEQQQIRSNRIVEEFNDLQRHPTKEAIDGKISNPYRAPPIENLLKDPNFSKTALSQIVTKQMEATPSQQITPEFVLALAKRELANGTAYTGPGSIEKAANDLQTYFTAITKANNQAMSFDKWNLPVQSSYYIKDQDFMKRKTITTDLAKSLSSPLEAIFKKLAIGVTGIGPAIKAAPVIEKGVQAAKNLVVPDYVQVLRKAGVSSTDTGQPVETGTGGIPQ